MSWLSKLFGNCGSIRFEGVMEDGTGFSGKCEIESFNNSKEDIEEGLKKKMYIETGKVVNELKITAFL